MAGQLDGLRVIEGSAFVAAPLAGMTLAQMGADVIRFDLPGGGLDSRRWPVTKDGRSLFWAGLNKGKRSVAVDFTKPEGKELISALICAPGPDAGVFLTNLKVQGWTDYETLRARREDVILVSVLGTRDGGPAVDYTVNPGAGFPMATGPEGSTEPVAHVLPAWDCITGQMAALGLLAAERRRRATGEGQEVALALKDVASAMLGNLGVIGEVTVNGEDRPKAGNALYGAFGQDFETADGRRVMVIGLTARQWKGLVRATGTGEAMASLAQGLGVDLGEEGERFRARKEIAAQMAPWFAARPLAEIAEALDANGVTWSPFRSFAQAVAEDPDLSEANPMFATIDQPGVGPLLTPGSPFAFSGVARETPAPAPLLGADTEAVLAEVLGLGSGAIGALFDSGVAAGPAQP
ncbi:CoA transferase [Rubrimonas cliftonensis]|uniref:Mesaconyl-CoA C1-C4 CoA transferase n=1 Tax=Rubrimonas cliftonensis TaxID=89524 RepID=A0A1H3W624_9RHOB|nr:CoA transferase [Rubrimonas cliftonensis]SDZ82579.1 mesaconyl-CoA C1-C4 CoA transferase [Rubrimonas cliftonensis]